LKEPQLNTTGKGELREMEGEHGKFVFFFNHGKKAAEVVFEEDLEKPAVGAREIVQDKKIDMNGKGFAVKTVVPAQSVRIWRIDY
jgi:hypothetical protein